MYESAVRPTYHGPAYFLYGTAGETRSVQPHEHSPPRPGGPAPLTVDADGRTNDPTAEAARSNVERATSYLRSSFGRNGLDGNGGSFAVVVHAAAANDAYWSPRFRQIELGDGDGTTFGPLATSPSVVAHELYHGVVEAEVALSYDVPQEGAIHESLADVFAASVTGSWRVAEDVYTPQIAGDALRDLTKPTIANMAEVGEEAANAHALSGVASLAAVRAAEKLGIDEVGKVWYRALVDHLPDHARFPDLATATIKAAAALHGEAGAGTQAIRDAWESVGVLVGQ